ncbi:MAG: CopG family transcriptional regulator [Candidatus Aenigmarchaeota archaeon]|nr:CopG family transcriptional regulator [Candidatus Aenigmarchaeota archaeon]
MKKNRKERKEKTFPRFTKEQLEVIDSLRGPYGAERSQVISTIVVMWLHEQKMLLKIKKE